MKKNIEITGILRAENETWNVVDLFSNDVKLGEFVFNPKHKSINVELSKCMGKVLDINVTDYLDYMKLIADLGLEIPESYKRHWTPKTGEDYFYIDFEGKVCPNYIANCGYNEVDRRRRENFNMFPTRELAEKTINVSRLGRLILLWQYANDCIFETDWKNNSQRKYIIKHDHINNTISCNFSITAQSDTVYFETSEQAKTFIKAYDKEIKKIMEVI